MKEDLVANAAPRYRAFVSYSHADARFAAWLHRKLEASRLPDGTRLAPIFIDRAELAAGPDLSAQVRGALSESAALVVIASPAARASRWVGQEIELFRQLHPGRPILAALIAGEPDEAFPDPLLRRNGAALEPLAADFREGQDGKRLGLLKIAAGLSAQPLDRLVQRDAQSRQRRVMAVTAGAVILSLVLSALLVVALRARAEAERQRAEAEGLVEFMLTDLRDKLRGTGDPKIMASVNQQALDYYSTMDLTKLSDDSLDRRARVLHAMGEDNERLGNFPVAQAMYQEAWRITKEVLDRRPDHEDAIFAHAQSEFWIGKAAWEQGDLKTTEVHWRAYKDLAEQLKIAEPNSSRSLMELGYSSGNLCELESRKRSDARDTMSHCEQSEEYIAKALASDPDNQRIALALANRLGWHADALVESGDASKAIPLRKREAAIVDDLLVADPNSPMLQQRRTWPMIGEAKALAKLNRHSAALEILVAAEGKLARLAQAHLGDTTIAEQRLRIAWLQARSARATKQPIAGIIGRARLLHSELARKYTAAQMIRFDRLIEQIEKGN